MPLLQPLKRTHSLAWIAALWLALSSAALAQVHYHPDGNPWKQRANSGPDAEVPGWYYNLGVSGIRVELMKDRPEALMVRYVFPDSPADGKVEIGDWIIGAADRKWKVPHQNGYGMEKFGPQGPIATFAEAMEDSQSKQAKGKLSLTIEREGKASKVSMKVGKFAPDLEKLLDYLVEHQKKDGSWGSAPQNTFAPLALMASRKKSHQAAVLKNVRMHAKTTKAEDDSWLINWRYMAAAIVMSEYYLATKEKWVLPELQEVYDFLITTQYMSMDQINPKAKESHPHTYPKSEMDSHGGWGHNPGFEGYGPIAMITAQGALAFAMMEKCGIEVDRERHEAAYAFLDRGAGKNHYVWYKDQAAGQQDWADMGRTGAAAIASHMCEWSGKQRKRGQEFASVIGLHPQSFPDTHASPLMGMAYGALGASVNAKAYRSLMAANRWWFTLALCGDGSFCYQPNRDNNGYGAGSRLEATAAVAFMLSIPAKATVMTGRE
jgi:hypothetical protein